MSAAVPGRPRPQRIDAVLPGVLKQVAQHHGVLATVQRAWPRLVGKRLTAHTKPVSLRRGRLVVHVERPGDNFTLTYQRVELLEQLRTLTDGRVSELVIRPGRI